MQFAPVTDQQRASLADESAQIPGYIVYDAINLPICWAWRNSEFYTAVLFQYPSPSIYLN